MGVRNFFLIRDVKWFLCLEKVEKFEVKFVILILFIFKEFMRKNKIFEVRSSLGEKNGFIKIFIF